MTQNDIDNKIGAMHERFLDDEEQYRQLLNDLLEYKDQYSSSYGLHVLSALKQGEVDMKRYLTLENALSPRKIVIEKQKKTISDQKDTKGAYHVVFVMDDESRHEVHFDRKKDQLLYILILLASFKNGWLSSFCKSEQTTPAILETVAQLVRLIYPHTKEKDAFSMAKDLSPDSSFSDIIQKMKSPINQCMKDAGFADDTVWFMPYPASAGRMRLYRVKMPLSHILYPSELQPILDALPDACQYAPIPDVSTSNDELQAIGDEFSQEQVDDIILGAEKGHPEEQLRLGLCYLTGAGLLPLDFSKAREWFQKAARGGNAEAMNQLAMMYQEGRGVKVNLAEAFSWWKQSAEQGNAEGLYYLGVFYGTGDVVRLDYKKSRAYFEQADQLGYDDASYQLGLYYQFGMGVKANIEKALEYFERAASNGHADAAEHAAQIYYRGNYGVTVDYKKAFDLYLIAADQNHEESMWYVINGYLTGEGTEQNHEKALELIMRAYELGYHNILVLTGIHFFMLSDDDSLDIAEQLFTESAELGNAMAYYMMGRIVIRRNKGENTLAEALKWFDKGAYYGNEKCIEIIKQHFPDIYEEHKAQWTRTVSLREALFSLIHEIGKKEAQETFITLVDAYRERWQESYLEEICKQLHLHKHSDNDGDGGGTRRRIIVKSTSKGKTCYQVVLVTADGKEIPVNPFNPNALILFLLTIICSFKSGYSTIMATSSECIPLLRQLVNLVLGQQYSDKYLDGYIEQFMTNSPYYSQYSNITKGAVAKAVDHQDDPIHYLFSNVQVGGRKNLRRMCLDPQNIVIPDELADLALHMPDAGRVIQLPDYQQDTSIVTE